MNNLSIDEKLDILKLLNINQLLFFKHTNRNFCVLIDQFEKQLTCKKYRISGSMGHLKKIRPKRVICHLKELEKLSRTRGGRSKSDN